jgi:hypothetical protein
LVRVVVVVPAVVVRVVNRVVGRARPLAGYQRNRRVSGGWEGVPPVLEATVAVDAALIVMIAFVAFLVV